MKVKIKKINPLAIEPTYATEGSAAFDLYAPSNLSDILMCYEDKSIIDIGIAFEIPEDHVMLITGRSGMAFKHDVRLANCIGVIDSDYRDTVRVKLVREADSFAVNVGEIKVSAGDRIAQGFIIPIYKVRFDVVDELSETDRDGGLGSTGGFGGTTSD